METGVPMAAAVSKAEQLVDVVVILRHPFWRNRLDGLAGTEVNVRRKVVVLGDVQAAAVTVELVGRDLPVADDRTHKKVVVAAAAQREYRCIECGMTCNDTVTAVSSSLCCCSDVSQILLEEGYLPAGVIESRRPQSEKVVLLGNRPNSATDQFAPAWE